jgi:hypothetical protein
MKLIVVMLVRAVIVLRRLLRFYRVIVDMFRAVLVNMNFTT